MPKPPISIITYMRHLIAVSLLISTTSPHPIYEFDQQAFMIPHPEKAHRGG